jgi:putative Holliday junction resolvase
MAKIVALDVGAKRTGIAESDPMHMMAFPLETVETASLLTFIQRRQEVEAIEELVVGAPVRWDGTPSEVAHSSLTVFVKKSVRNGLKCASLE